MTRGDLEHPDLEELDWTPDRRDDSLSVVYQHAVGLATRAEQWYASKRPPKKHWGRGLRVGAIALGSLAAVLPILGEIFADGEAPALAPGWAAVALLGAAALIGLDRYFGFSAGWMRFMTAELTITRLRHDFEYQWQVVRATIGSVPSDADVIALLERAREMVLAVDDVINGETGAWIAEFRSTLETTGQSLGTATGP